MALAETSLATLGNHFSLLLLPTAAATTYQVEFSIWEISDGKEPRKKKYCSSSGLLIKLSLEHSSATVDACPRLTWRRFSSKICWQHYNAVWGRCNQSHTSPNLNGSFSNPWQTLLLLPYWLPIGFFNYLLLHLNPQQDGLQNNCRKIEILQADIWQQMSSEINQLTFYLIPRWDSAMTTIIDNNNYWCSGLNSPGLNCL